MTITFLNLYNEIAAQPWSMFDSNAESESDFEPALVSTINKALVDIWYSYPFSFRLKTHSLITFPKQATYNLPQGNIKNETSIEENLFSVSINGKYLEYTDEPQESQTTGIPTSFSIENDSIILSPIPDKKYVIKIKYLTLAIGYDKDDNEIFCLEKPTDYILIPEKYETLFKNVVIAKTLLESIVSVNDDNYVGYKLQFDKAYKLFLKVTNPVQKSKTIKI